MWSDCIFEFPAPLSTAKQVQVLEASANGTLFGIDDLQGKWIPTYGGEVRVSGNYVTIPGYSRKCKLEETDAMISLRLGSSIWKTKRGMELPQILQWKNKHGEEVGWQRESPDIEVNHISMIILAR